MRIVIQRVSSVSVSINARQHSAIGHGLLILVGISLVCAAVMSLVLVETVRLFFTSHMIDYFRYIFC